MTGRGGVNGTVLYNMANTIDCFNQDEYRIVFKVADSVHVYL